MNPNKLRLGRIAHQRSKFHEGGGHDQQTHAGGGGSSSDKGLSKEAYKQMTDKALNDSIKTLEEMKGPDAKAELHKAYEVKADRWLYDRMAGDAPDLEAAVGAKAMRVAMYEHLMDTSLGEIPNIPREIIERVAKKMVNSHF